MVAIWLAAFCMVAVRNPVRIGDMIRDFYLARWGMPSRVAKFEMDDLDVEVLKWDADGHSEGVTLYATIGASSKAMLGRDPSHRVEFFVGLVPAQDDIASPLAALALYPTREGVSVGPGHMVSADAPFWSATEMRRFLIMRPVGDFLPALELPEGIHVDFLQAIPIFESEAAYANEHGAEALLGHWEASSVRFWDPRRSSKPAS